jgi:hypothetical protein
VHKAVDNLVKTVDNSSFMWKSPATREEKRGEKTSFSELRKHN